jgi:hypothetical protein
VARSISIVIGVVATTVLIARFAAVPGEPSAAWARMFLPAAAGVQLAGSVAGEALCPAPVVLCFRWMGETLSCERLSSGGRENQYRPAAIIRRLFLRPATHAHRLQLYRAHHHVRLVLYRSFWV